MHPVLAEQLIRNHMADRLAEAEAARRTGGREAALRRWRRVLGYRLIAAGERLSQPVKLGSV